MQQNARINTPREVLCEEMSAESGLGHNKHSLKWYNFWGELLECAPVVMSEQELHNYSLAFHLAKGKVRYSHAQQRQQRKL